MEPESSLPYPQVSATCLYPEPAPSSPHHPLQLPEDLNIILPSTYGSPQWSPSLRLGTATSRNTRGTSRCGGSKNKQLGIPSDKKILEYFVQQVDAHKAPINSTFLLDALPRARNQKELKRLQKLVGFIASTEIQE
jgi:hypothetical protein